MSMSLTGFFALLGGLLVLAFVANRLARRTRVPDVVVLMATGVLLGPVLGLVQASRFQTVTHGFGTLALILILFEAGLELEIRETVRHFPGGFLLAILSYGLSVMGGAAICRYGMHLSWLAALTVGAVMGCLSSSIILPVLQQVELRRPVRVTLMVEASFGDALAVLTVGILLDIARGSSETGSVGVIGKLLVNTLLSGNRAALVGGLVGSFLLKTLIALLLAVLTGIVWSRLLPVLSEERFWHVLTFAAVLLLYAGTAAAGGSELFAVIAFGMMLANLPKNRHLLGSAFTFLSASSRHHEQLLLFHSELGFLVRTFFFVLIGAIVEFKGFRAYFLEALGIVGALFLARWLAVQASRMAWRGIEARERELAYLMIPRGLINAVLALEVIQQRGTSLGFLTSLVFAVILLTNGLLLAGTVRAHGVAAQLSAAAADAQGTPTAVAATAAAGNAGTPAIPDLEPEPEGEILRRPGT